jgi:hypothetical protein
LLSTAGALTIPSLPVAGNSEPVLEGCFGCRRGKRVVERLPRVVIACAAALTIAGSAWAGQIVFETVAAPAAQVGTSCPAPCFNVQMFFEDPTRSLEIQALQFDVGIVKGGAAAKLPVPPNG